MRLLYSLAAYLLAPLFAAVLLWRGNRRHFSERLGTGPRVPARGIWLHAASVGEVQAAAPLVRSLRERYPTIPVIVTTLTQTGRERVQALFGDTVHSRYLPLDLPGAVRRFFDRIDPRLAVIFETELWPNLYRECGRRRVPLILASARISPRSFPRYRRMAALFRQTLSRGIVVAAQGQDDAERFRSIGADPAHIHVTGNIKFDLSVPSGTLERGRALRERHAAGRPVWIAGSTHAGEEQQVLAAHRRLSSNALLILVPRHPNRFGEVADWLVREGVRFTRRSQETVCDAGTEVLLVDSLGELLDFYAAADVAFVGGSLVPVGGHNLLEPAALGLPVLTGPNYFNSESIARLLIERGAARVVQDGELAAAVAALLADGEARSRMGARGRAAIEENRGALARLLGLIAPLLS